MGCVESHSFLMPRWEENQIELAKQPSKCRYRIEAAQLQEELLQKQNENEKLQQYVQSILQNEELAQKNEQDWIKINQVQRS